MNSNSSPHSRSVRRPHRRPRSTANAAPVGSARQYRGSSLRAATSGKCGQRTPERKKTAPAAAELTMRQRIRKVGLMLAVPHLVLIMSVIVIAVTALLISSQSVAILPTVIAIAWLIFQAAPVAGEDVVISAVPLAPALITIALSARQVNATVRKRFSIIDLLMVFAWSLVIPLVLTVIALLMLADAQAVYPVAVPPIASVFLSVLIIHLLAFVCGLGPKAWRALARRYRVQSSIVDGIVLGAKTLGWLSLAALGVGIVLFALSWGKQEEIMVAYPQAQSGGKLALIVLSLLYIPNAIIGVAGVLFGSEYQFGAASVSLFETHLVPLPPVPIMGLVPASSASWAWVGLFIPIAVIVVVMWRMRPSPIATLSAGLSAWLLMAAAGYLSGGEIGAYDNTGVPVLWTASLALIWIGGIALAVTLMLFVFQRRQASALVAENYESAATAQTTEATENAGVDDFDPEDNAFGDAAFEHAEDVDAEYSEYAEEESSNLENSDVEDSAVGEDVVDNAVEEDAADSAAEEDVVEEGVVEADTVEAETVEAGTVDENVVGDDADDRDESDADNDSGHTDDADNGNDSADRDESAEK